MSPCCRSSKFWHQLGNFLSLHPDTSLPYFLKENKNFSSSIIFYNLSFWPKIRYRPMQLDTHWRNYHLEAQQRGCFHSHLDGWRWKSVVADGFSLAVQHLQLETEMMHYSQLLSAHVLRNIHALLVDNHNKHIGCSFPKEWTLCNQYNPNIFPACFLCSRTTSWILNICLA